MLKTYHINLIKNKVPKEIWNNFGINIIFKFFHAIQNNYNKI